VDSLTLSLPGQSGGRIKPVDGVSFTLQRGECVGLVGESGCGKSLTALSLLGLTRSLPGARLGGQVKLAAPSGNGNKPQSVRRPPSAAIEPPLTGSADRGHRTADGFQDLLSLPDSQFARLRGRRMAMIFQDPLSALNPLLTIEAQLAEALTHAEHGLSRPERRARCVELLAATGMAQPERRLAQYPYQLSGGLRQRVMIAMALAGAPDLLLADEPTTALDVTVQAQILLELKRLQRERDMAVLFITHDLGVVAQLCSRVIVMYAGRVVEDSPAGQFFGGPLHPYSRALLDSLPQRAERGQPLRSIPGSPPQPGQFPAACRFHPRCPLCIEVCREQYPPWVTADAAGAACWRTGEAGSAVEAARTVAPAANTTE
jgi:oligopeptide/dipeptide ABC transporter ATP-binding protein